MTEPEADPFLTLNLDTGPTYFSDTSEADEAIDLDSISTQLIALDKVSHATDATIAAICKELGIKPPFAAA